MKLGVRTTFTREKNLEIIFSQYKQTPEHTLKQINFLSHFSEFKHKKGLEYPYCTCLRCHAVRVIEASKELGISVESIMRLDKEHDKRLLESKP